MERATSRTIVTPEAVPLDVDVAGLGSRMIALIVDLLIQVALLVLVSLAFSAADGHGTGIVIAYLIVGFTIVWGYFPLFEGLWNGRTPGKRAESLRVVRADGRPVTFAAVLVRNLVRFVDAIPGTYAVGAVAVLLTRRSQRLGDLAAGTIVIRERKSPPPAPLDLAPLSTSAEAGRGVDPAKLGEPDYALIRSFLQRRSALDQAARAHLASQVAGAIRARVGLPVRPDVEDERFLEALAVAYRDRYAAPPPGPDHAPDL